MALLNAIDQVPSYQWNYIHDVTPIEHAGPLAEDFYAAFGLGADASHLSPLDLAAVAAIGVQALWDKIEVQDQQIEAAVNELLSQIGN